MITIPIWLFSVMIGLIIIGVLVFIMAMIATSDVPTPKFDCYGNSNSFCYSHLYENRATEKALNEIDNEVRGKMRKIVGVERGKATRYEPTLKGRVDMIEEYLSIRVTVDQPTGARLSVHEVSPKKERR